jgi:hypothetical protein
MPKILINTALASAALRDAATTLKAAIAVSAAAILSESKADLEANAAAAARHFDAFGDKLDALRDGILKGSANAAALALISSAGTVEIESMRLAKGIAMIHSLIKSTKRILFNVVGTATRNGIDVFADQVGILGRSFQSVSFSVGEPMPATPLQFDQFFLETMADLGQRDWSA